MTALADTYESSNAATGLPAAVAKTVERHAVAIDRCKSKGIALIFEIGEHLQAAHDALANRGDGTFGKWCKERCGYGVRTAYRYIAIAEAFGDQKQLICAPGAKTFDVKALEYLASDTTPEEATRDALKLAKKGERVTLATAKELAEKYTVGDEEEDDGDLPEFTKLAADTTDKIRSQFRSWPHEYADEISGILSLLMTEDHDSWLQ